MNIWLRGAGQEAPMGLHKGTLVRKPRRVAVEADTTFNTDTGANGDPQRAGWRRARTNGFRLLWVLSLSILVGCGGATAARAAAQSRRRLYTLGDHAVLVIDADTGSTVSKIAVGDPAFVGPRSAAAARGRVYLVAPGGGEIVVIDTSTNAISGAIQVP
jgi:DNA-binding beta-propeller fold protein YncE